MQTIPPRAGCEKFLYWYQATRLTGRIQASASAEAYHAVSCDAISSRWRGVASICCLVI